MKNATNPKTMEQVACLETALRAMERPRIETPAQILNLLARRMIDIVAGATYIQVIM